MPARQPSRRRRWPQLPATVSRAGSALERYWVATALWFLVPVVSLLVLMLVTGLTFQALTAIEIPWRAALRGGATTALLGLTAAFLVGFYLNTVGNTGTLGALGGVAILLFFFNLMWVVYLFGVEVTKVYADYLEYGDIPQPGERGSDRDVRPVGRIVPDTANGSRTVAFSTGAVLGFLWCRSVRSARRMGLGWVPGRSSVGSPGDQSVE